MLLCKLHMCEYLHTVSLLVVFCGMIHSHQGALPSLLCYPGLACRGSAFSDIMQSFPGSFAYVCKIDVSFHFECQVDVSVLNST